MVVYDHLHFCYYYNVICGSQLTVFKLMKWLGKETNPKPLCSFTHFNWNNIFIEFFKLFTKKFLSIGPLPAKTVYIMYSPYVLLEIPETSELLILNIFTYTFFNQFDFMTFSIFMGTISKSLCGHVKDQKPIKTLMLRYTYLGPLQQHQQQQQQKEQWQTIYPDVKDRVMWKIQAKCLQVCRICCQTYWKK